MNKDLVKTFMIAVLFCCAAIVLTGCPDDKIKVNGIKGKVTTVVNGNTIKLANGLQIELLGVLPSALSQKYLEDNVKGKVVEVVRDSKQPETINTYNTKVKAYVKLQGEKMSISGKLLLSKNSSIKTAVEIDSLKVFIDYVKEKQPHPVMTSEEVLAYMKPRTFLIRTESGTGTGFFIGPDGLALTNNHVWDGRESALVCYFGENGTLDTSNTRQMNSIVHSVSGEKVDYTIFYVQLRPGEKSQYMPLVRERIAEGSELYKLGCGLSQPADFQKGILSNYYEGGYLKHSVDTNHGDSGGPIVNNRGEVVGINQSIDFNKTLNEQAKGIAYAVDAVLIKQYLDEHNIEYGR